MDRVDHLMSQLSPRFDQLREQERLSARSGSELQVEKISRLPNLCFTGLVWRRAPEMPLADEVGSFLNRLVIVDSTRRNPSHVPQFWAPPK